MTTDLATTDTLWMPHVDLDDTHLEEEGFYSMVVEVEGSKPQGLTYCYHWKTSDGLERGDTPPQRDSDFNFLCPHDGRFFLSVDVSDPDGIEGSVARLPGLGLLPIHTTMTAEKTTRQVTFEFEGQTCSGYEIHQGVSDTREAILQADHCVGTYIHGFLDNAPVIDWLLSRFQVSGSKAKTLSPAEFKNQQYDRLAEHVRRYVDVDKVYQILTDD